MALKAWLERKLHPGPYLAKDLKEMSSQLTGEPDYKQVIDKALERVEILNVVYKV